MRLILATPLAIAFMLAACGDSGKSDQPKTVEQAASEAAATLAKPQPGKYSTTVKIISFDVPGLPAEQAEQMKKMMSSAGTHTAEYCLTKEEADKGFEEMAKKSSAQDCVYDKFEATANTVDAKMTCKSPQGAGTTTMTMNGTITSTSMRMVMEGEQNMPGLPGNGIAKTKIEATSQRIGDCT